MRMPVAVAGEALDTAVSATERTTMPEQIQNITVTLQTATQEKGERTFDRRVEAEFDSHVYLGAAGREFCCRSAGDRIDFRAGATDIFIFGGDTNVLNAPINDPQDLMMSDIERHPVYIRFDPHPYDQDNWCLERAELTVDNATSQLCLHASALVGEAHLWLGRESGHILHLT
jgi:hypothetical protein